MIVNPISLPDQKLSHKPQVVADSQPIYVKVADPKPVSSNTTLLDMISGNNLRTVSSSQIEIPEGSIIKYVSDNSIPTGEIYFVCKPRETGVIYVYAQQHLFPVYFDGLTNYAGPYILDNTSFYFYNDRNDFHITVKTGIKDGHKNDYVTY